MSRNHLSLTQLKFPQTGANRLALYTKLADFDTALDALQTGGGSADYTVGTVGGKLGFFGGTTVTKPTTYTLTYSTTAKTIPVATAHTITDSTGGSPSTSTLAAMASSVTAAVTDTTAALKSSVDAQLVIAKNNVATLAAELALTQADLLAVKKVLTAVVTDLQALGLVA